MSQVTQEQQGNSYTAAEKREQEQDPVAEAVADLAVDAGVDFMRFVLAETNMVPVVRTGDILFRFVDVAEAA